MVSGVVKVTGDEGHFELGGGAVRREGGGGDIEKAAFVDEKFGLFGIVGDFVREETDGFFGFFGNAADDRNIAGATKRVVEIAVSEASVGGEGSASEAFFEEELAFEVFEVGEGINIIAVKTVEVGAAVGNEIDAGGRNAADGGTETSDGAFGVGDGFGSLAAKGFVIPDAAGDLVNGFVIKTGIAFEDGFVVWGEKMVDKLGVGLTESVEVEGIGELVEVAVGGVGEKVFEVGQTAETIDFAEVKITNIVGAGGREVRKLGSFGARGFGCGSGKMVMVHGDIIA